MKLLITFAVLVASTLANPNKPPFAFIEELHGSKGRIIEGEPAELGQFPWQVVVRLNTPFGGAFCGGTLIDEEWVLTAGHCVEGAISFDIQLGTLSSSDNTGVSMHATKFIRHENYDPYTINNDIAVIKLPSPVKLNDNIQTVRLASRGNKVGVKESVTVSGWGKTSDASLVVSPVLNYVSLETVSNSFCASVYGSQVIISSTLCAVGHPRNSPCNGDSGGPLVQYDSNGVATHVGIVSFVHIDGCASGNPAGFVRTESYLDWIKANTGLDV